MGNKLKQLFQNNTDCYADTWEDVDAELHNGCHLLKEGEVIPAMTSERFIEVVSALFPSDTEIERAAEVKYPDYSVEVEIVEANRTAYISGAKDLRDGGINRDKTN